MATSLLDWIMHLLQNPEAREHFQADPQGAMTSAGLGSVCGQDVRDARAFLLDNPNVHPLNDDKAAVRGEAGHDHVKHIVDNYAFAPSHKAENVVPVAHTSSLRADHIRGDGNNDHPAPAHRPVHVGRTDHYNDHDSHNRYAHIDDRHDRHAHLNDSNNAEERHEFGVGPTTEGGTGGDLHHSRVAHDQLEMGGRGNLLGDGNDFSDRHSTNQTRTDTASSRQPPARPDRQRQRCGRPQQPGQPHQPGGPHRHDGERQRQLPGHDLHADHTNSHTNVSGNGSAGHDVHVDKNGPVMGQGMANGDIDHTGSLAGLDHTVSVGDVNLLSGLVNTGDVLDGSLDHSLNHAVDHSPILSPLSDDPILSNDPILSGDLNRSPVLSGDLNNSLNHVLNGDLNHDLNGDLNHSLNHLGQGSLDDLLHNTDVHDIHDIVEHILGLVVRQRARPESPASPSGGTVGGAGASQFSIRARRTALQFDQPSGGTTWEGKQGVRNTSARPPARESRGSPPPDRPR